MRFHIFVLCAICVDRVGHAENWWASSEKYGLCLTGGWCAFELHHRYIYIYIQFGQIRVMSDFSDS